MKKTFKRAGVAVLSMAMLLSMGTIGLTANAAGESITVNASTGLTAGDKVKVYKVAEVDSLTHTWAWTNAAVGTAVGVDFATIDTYNDDDANMKALAAKVERAVVANSVSATETGTVGTAINLETAGAGYYLVVAAPNDATKVAQPILKEVKGAETVGNTKTETVSLTKKITEVKENGTDKPDNIQDTGKNAMAKAGDVVTYRIESKLPSYDSNVTPANVKQYVMSDTSSATLTSCTAENFKVFISADNTATTGTDAKTYLSRNSGQNFTVTIPGTNLLTYGGQYLIVEFTATVSEDPIVSKNLGARLNVDDTTKDQDANKNDVVVTFGNDYATGTDTDKDGDGKIDDNDETPLKDYADVYVSALRIDKTLDGTSAAADDVGFTLYKADGTTVVMAEKKTDSNGKVAFVGLDAGTYVIKETTGKAGYKKVSDITVEITSTTPFATFNLGTEDGGFQVDATNGGFKQTIDNPSLETLPGTGGMGTTLFTVGGAVIVLMAGFMFVLYMRKRKTEE